MDGTHARGAARVAAVTGAARGIGRAIALRFAAAGYGVAVIDVDDGAARDVVREISARGGRARPFHLDVGDGEAAVAAAVRAIEDQLGPIAVLVNNAAVMGTALSGVDADVASTPRSVWLETLTVNLVAPAMLVRHVLPGMVAAGGGCILNIGSAGASFGDGRNVAYRASKAALESLTKSIAVSHGAQGVRANCIAPGVTRSPGMLNQSTQSQQEVYGRFRVTLEPGEPDEVAALALFLASDEARYVNGQTYRIDGGMTAIPPWYALGPGGVATPAAIGHPLAPVPDGTRPDRKVERDGR